MGAGIPDSPPLPAKPSRQVPLAARRPLVTIPPLDLSCLGSPRSPYVCLSASDRRRQHKAEPSFARSSDRGNDTANMGFDRPVAAPSDAP
ncbi:hypothetical protein Ae201684P_000733 [Aphanomyces euteiches]|nr:hypothetical protein Ae201684P_000733 [Aphanomyces euteiches]